MPKELLPTKAQLDVRYEWINETVQQLNKQPVLSPNQETWIDWALLRLKEIQNNLILGIYASPKRVSSK